MSLFMTRWTKEVGLTANQKENGAVPLRVSNKKIVINKGYYLFSIIYGIIKQKGGFCMKQAWSDLKSFVTIAMIILLFVIVIANLLGCTLEQNILILVTNLITAVFTYYFSRPKQNEKKEEDKNDEIEK